MSNSNSTVAEPAHRRIVCDAQLAKVCVHSHTTGPAAEKELATGCEVTSNATVLFGLKMYAPED